MTDPAQVQRGTVALTTALRYPRCCLAGRDLLDPSDVEHRRRADARLATQPGSDAYGMRLPTAIVDNYRRELANLGDTRWSPEP
jgi:hypothetical protein